MSHKTTRILVGFGVFFCVAIGGILHSTERILQLVKLDSSMTKKKTKKKKTCQCNTSLEFFKRGSQRCETHADIAQAWIIQPEVDRQPIQIAALLTEAVCTRLSLMQRTWLQRAQDGAKQGKRLDILASPLYNGRNVIHLLCSLWSLQFSCIINGAAHQHLIKNPILMQCDASCGSMCFDSA